MSRDGTTSTVCFIGELMKQAERYINEGVHPRVLVEVSLKAVDGTAHALHPSQGRLVQEALEC